MQIEGRIRHMKTFSSMHKTPRISFALFFFLGMTRVRVKLFFYLQFIYQNIRSIYFLCRVGPDELPCYTWKMPQCFMDVHKKCSNFPSKKRNDISLIPLGVIYTGAMLCNNYHHYPLKKSVFNFSCLEQFSSFQIISLIVLLQLFRPLSLTRHAGRMIGI